MSRAPRMTPEERDDQVRSDPKWAVAHALLLASLDQGDWADSFLVHLEEAGFTVSPIGDDTASP